MSIEENKAVVYRFMREWISDEASLPLDDAMAKSGQQHARGAYAWHLLQATLTDTDFEPEHTIAEDDFVVVLGKFHGLQERALFGIPADNRGITVRVAFAFRLERGAIAEYWVEFEPWSLLEQLDIDALAHTPQPHFGVHPG